MNLSDNPTWKSAAVADLAFILLSPSLINEDSASFILNPDKITNWLKALDQNDLSLQLHLKRKKIRKLGWYAEELMTFFFSNYPDYNLLGHNIQLFDGNTTKGEIDFILEDVQTNKIIQIELATKFYLHYNLDNSTVFIGPNASDNFDRKHHHLLNHQLRANNPKEVQELTKNRQIDLAVPFIKGVLFYPLKNPRATTNFNYISPFHNRGWYCSLAELLENNEIRELWSITKMNWLGLSDPKKISRKEFKTHFTKLFKEGNRAIMVLNNCNERGFIMSDEWPN